MALKPTDLTLKTLGELLPNRVLEIAFDEALQKIKNDLAQRRRVDAKRSMNLALTFKPKMDAEGYIGECDVEIDISTKVPGVELGSRVLLGDVDIPGGEVGLGLLFLKQQETAAAKDSAKEETK